MKEKYKNILLVIGIILGSFLIMFYSMNPTLHEFRESIYGDIIFYLFLFGICLFLALRKSRTTPLILKIIIIAFPVLHTLLSILKVGKLSYFVMFLYSLLNILTSVIIYIKTKEEYKGVWLIGAYAFLISIYPVLRAKYINSELPFWEISLVLTLVALSISLIIGLCRYTINKRIGDAIGIPLLTVIITFSVSWLTICSFNVIFDKSIPEYEDFVIINKKIRSGSRQITTYEFEVENSKSSFMISVSESSYYDYEIGDDITLSIYAGAFNERYYLYE